MAQRPRRENANVKKVDHRNKQSSKPHVGRKNKNQNTKNQRGSNNARGNPKSTLPKKEQAQRQFKYAPVSERTNKNKSAVKEGLDDMEEKLQGYQDIYDDNSDTCSQASAQTENSHSMYLGSWLFADGSDSEDLRDDDAPGNITYQTTFPPCRPKTFDEFYPFINGNQVLIPWELHKIIHKPEVRDGVPGAVIFTKTEKPCMEVYKWYRYIRADEVVLGSGSYTGVTGVYYAHPGPGNDSLSWSHPYYIKLACATALKTVEHSLEWNPILLENSALAYLRDFVVPWPSARYDIQEYLNGIEIIQELERRTLQTSLVSQQRRRQLLELRLLRVSDMWASRFMIENNLITDDLELCPLRSILPILKEIGLSHVSNALVLTTTAVSAFFLGKVALLGLPVYLCIRAWKIYHRLQSVLKTATSDAISTVYKPASVLSILKTCSQPLSGNVPPLHVSSPECPKFKEPRDMEMPCATTRSIEIFGSTIIGAPVVVPQGCHHDQRNGARIRLLFARWSSISVQNEFRTFFHQTIIPRLTGPFAEYSEEEWIDHLPPKRKKILKEALPSPHLIDDADIDIFVKQEAYIGKTRENFKPRLILGRRPEFSKAVGPWLYGLAKWINTSFDEYSPSVNDSGFDALRLGEIAQECRRYKYLVESDVSNWDGTFSKLFRELEIDAIKKCPFIPENILNQLVRVWKTTRCIGKNGFSFTYDWGRNSGELLTSAFNGLFNIAITEFTLLKMGNSPGSHKLLCKGDDNFYGCDHFDEKEASNIYQELGFPKVVFKIRHTILDLEYCSGKFYMLDDGAYKWGVKPFRTLTKLGWNFNNHSRKVHLRLLRGTAISLLPIAGHVPILGTLLRTIVGFDVQPIFPPYEPWKTSSNVVNNISDVSVNHFLAVNGWTISQYSQVVEQLTALRPEHFPIAFDHYLFLTAFNIESELPLDSYYNSFTFEAKPETQPHFPRVAADIATNLASALLEEGMRYLFPLPTTIFLASLEGSYHGILHFGLHVVFYLLPWYISLPAHLIYNIVVTLADYRNLLAPASALGLLLRESRAALFNVGDDRWLSNHREVVDLPDHSHGETEHCEGSPYFCSNKNKNRKSSKKQSPPRRGRKKQRSSGQGMSEAGLSYLCANALPFCPTAVGSRQTDAVSFPTAAYTCRTSFLMSTDLTYTTGSVHAFMPYVSASRLLPSAITVGGVATWPGTATSSANYANLATDNSAYRIVGGGIKLTSVQPITTAQGTVYILHVPLNHDTQRYGDDFFPTSFSAMATQNSLTTIPLASLTSNSRIIPFRRLDHAVNRFRSMPFPDAQAANGIDSMSGWCAIIVWIDGATPGTSLVRVDHVLHIEAIAKASTSNPVGAALPSPYDPRVETIVTASGASLPFSYVDTQDEKSLINQVVSGARTAAGIAGMALRGARMASEVYTRLRGPPVRNQPLIMY